MKKINTDSSISLKPLTYALEQNLIDHDFEIITAQPFDYIKQLEQGSIDSALIPSLAYARGKGNWKLVPGTAVSSSGAGKSILLIFNKDMRDIRTIAMDSRSETAGALLKILCAEHFRIEPEFRDVKASDPWQMLKEADAALVTGVQALHYQARHSSYFDLSEEWSIFSGLPFTITLWVGHEMSLSAEEVKTIQDSVQTGLKKRKEISAEFSKTNEKGRDFYLSYLTETLSYELGIVEKEGLLEFYRFAFYFGLINHLPDFHFF